MVWGLVLLIYGEQIRAGFDSHMIATYETAQECDEAVMKLVDAHRAAKWDQKPKNLKENVRYYCVATVQQ